MQCQQLGTSSQSLNPARRLCLRQGEIGYWLAGYVAGLRSYPTPLDAGLAAIGAASITWIVQYEGKRWAAAGCLGGVVCVCGKTSVTGVCAASTRHSLPYALLMPLAHAAPAAGGRSGRRALALALAASRPTEGRATSHKPWQLQIGMS